MPRQITLPGAELPASAEVRLIDTRALASSLQIEFENHLRGPDAAGR